jgi:hypothetical protein
MVYHQDGLEPSAPRIYPLTSSLPAYLRPPLPPPRLIGLTVVEITVDGLSGTNSSTPVRRYPLLHSRHLLLTVLLFFRLPYKPIHTSSLLLHSFLVF